MEDLMNADNKDGNVSVRFEKHKLHRSEHRISWYLKKTKFHVRGGSFSSFKPTENSQQPIFRMFRQKQGNFILMLRRRKQFIWVDDGQLSSLFRLSMVKPS